MSNFWSGAGGAILGGASGLFGMFGQRAREQRQFNNQKKLMGIQHVNQLGLNTQQMQHQMQLNQQGKDLQLQMWKDTNYPAQMAMLKEAGLNPSLMYGMSGGGGTTAGTQDGGQAQGGGASGGQASMSSYMDLGQSMLLGAQIAKLKAETANINKDTESKGKGIEVMDTQIGQMLQDIKNKKAQEQGQLIINELNKVDLQWKGKTLEQQLDILQWQSKKLDKEVDILNSEEYVTRETRETRVSAAKQDLANKWLQFQVMEKGIEVSNEQIKKMTKEIEVMDKGIEFKGQEITTEAFRAELQSKYPSIFNALGSGANDIINGIRGIFGAKIHDQVPKYYRD